MGLLMRGLIGANPPTVKLVTSLGWRRTQQGRYNREQVLDLLGSTHLGAAGQHQVASLAHEHAAVLHQLLTVEEGEASEQVADLPLTALQEGGGAGSDLHSAFCNRARGGGGVEALTECGPSITLTMSLTWMLFCSESKATAKRLSFLRFTA